MEQLLANKANQTEVSDMFSKRLENLFSEIEKDEAEINIDDLYGGIKFEKEKHVQFLKYCLFNLKKHESHDSHLITILHFVVGGLKMLNSLSREEIEKCVEYVLLNAVICKNKVKGFRSGTFTGWSCNKNYTEWNVEDKPHIAATYCAMCILKMCSYEKDKDNLDIEKITQKLKEIFKNDEICFDEAEIINEILSSQKESGPICSQSWDTESDVRFFYCAIAIFKMLGKSSGEIEKLINENSKKFLLGIKNFEGGFSMIEEGESNAGTTFCAVASYKMLDLEIPEISKLITWLCNRISSLGVNGRTNKVPDTCYSFWVLGSLTNLGLNCLLDRDHTIEFILNCQTIKGGFSKHLNFDQTELPDILHTFYSLCALTLLKYEGLSSKNTISFDPLLAIPLSN